MRATIAIGHELREQDWDLPTECPGWTVRDQFAHLVGVERAVLADPRPEHPMPDLAHMRNEFAQFTELDVDYRRDRSGPTVLAELEETLVRRLSVLRDPALTEESMLLGPFGMRPGRLTLGVRVFDIWAHGEDVRRATGPLADLDSAAAGVAVRWIRRALAKVIGADAGLPEGATVVLEVVGPHGFTEAVRVGAEGRGQRLTEVPADQTVHLSLGTEAFTRRACGRWPVDATPVEITGDAAAGQAVLTALAITP